MKDIGLKGNLNDVTRIQKITMFDNYFEPASLNVKEGEVVDMENRLFTSDQSLNIKLGEENDTEWQDLIEDKKDTHDKIIENIDELEYRRSLFLKALNILQVRQRF